MFLELIATFVAGIGAAGVVLLVNRIFGRRLPGWSMPIAAGATMLAFTIWSEYSWASRTIERLPEGMAVAETFETKAAWKPWTYAAPQVNRLMVVDRGNIRTNPNAPEVRLVDLYLFARWSAPNKVPQLVDCAAGRRADVSDDALADPARAKWIDLGADSALVRLSCSDTE